MDIILNMLHRVVCILMPLNYMGCRNGPRNVTLQTLFPLSEHYEQSLSNDLNDVFKKYNYLCFIKKEEELFDEKEVSDLHYICLKGSGLGLNFIDNTRTIIYYTVLSWLGLGYAVSHFSKKTNTNLQVMKRVVHCILQTHIGLIGLSLVRGYRKGMFPIVLTVLKVAQYSMTNNMKRVTSSWSSRQLYFE